MKLSENKSKATAAENTPLDQNESSLLDILATLKDNMIVQESDGSNTVEVSLSPEGGINLNLWFPHLYYLLRNIGSSLGRVYKVN